jgi:hypothetical protein
MGANGRNTGSSGFDRDRLSVIENVGLTEKQKVVESRLTGNYQEVLDKS